MTVRWPDNVDEILDGDQAVMFASVTPARGVVLTPLTNLALRDRESGTSTATNSSLGMWRKLERIRRNPNVAVVYHTRKHGYSTRPEYVLVQGRATLTAPDRRYMDSIRENFERMAGGHPRGGRIWQWLLRAWHFRVGIEVAVERVVVWPDLGCRGAPEVHGARLPEDPPAPQRPPARGTGPRLNHRRAAGRATSLPHLLLGWVDSDGFPFVVPAAVTGTEQGGIALDVPEGLVPPGGRRAGLTAHWFARYVIGQHQRIHTGWLEADPASGRVLYAPHTEAGYRLPPSKLAYKLGAAYVTRRGYRRGRRAGVLPEPLAGPRPPVGSESSASASAS